MSWLGHRAGGRERDDGAGDRRAQTRGSRAPRGRKNAIDGSSKICPRSVHVEAMAGDARTLRALLQPSQSRARRLFRPRNGTPATSGSNGSIRTTVSACWPPPLEARPPVSRSARSTGCSPRTAGSWSCSTTPRCSRAINRDGRSCSRACCMDMTERHRAEEYAAQTAQRYRSSPRTDPWSSSSWNSMRRSSSGSDSGT